MVFCILIALIVAILALRIETAKVSLDESAAALGAAEPGFAPAGAATPRRQVGR